MLPVKGNSWQDTGRTRLEAKHVHGICHIGTLAAAIKNPYVDF